MEWRQQLLVLALVTVAVAATVVAAAVATNTPPPADAGFGTAHDMVTLTGSPSVDAQGVRSLQHRFGRVDVIANEQLHVPGSATTFDLRAQDPHGPFGHPMLELLAGRYPTGPGQVALTPGLARALHVRLGGVWQADGTARRVVGTVENPENLDDAFALVPPGEVSQPTQETVLFDARGLGLAQLPPNATIATGIVAGNGFITPGVVVLALATVGMLLIALVAAGGFTVLAQRRLRALGMLASIGATPRQVGLVVRANGILVGLVGAALGLVAGLAGWLAYRPVVQASSHHLIGTWALPWDVVLPALALAVGSTWLAAARPARAVGRVPVVAALAGRPPVPAPTHRSALPGIGLLVVAFFLFGVSGANASHGGGTGQLVIGLVLLVAAVALLAPSLLALAGRLSSRLPPAPRLALRDLARYRSRSGSALAAITIGTLIAVIVCVAAAARYANALDYVGPNLTASQLLVRSQPAVGPVGRLIRPGPAGPVISHAAPRGATASPPPAAAIPPTPSPAAQRAAVRSIAAAIGATVVTLYTADADLNHDASGRNWNGPLYVATPQLLHALRIPASSIQAGADVITARPGISTLSKMQLLYGNAGSASPPHGPGGHTGPVELGPGGQVVGVHSCSPGSCVANPLIQELSALPSGTSAPNTLLTEHAVHQLGLHSELAGWFLETPRVLTEAQITTAQQTAGAQGLAVESRNSEPSFATIADGATLLGMALALGILAMTVGLVRSETAADRRTLAATGASSRTRRAVTATTAGALGLMGAVLGTIGGYVATIGWFRNNALDGLASLGSVPIANLLLLLLGVPAIAAVAGWLLGGREPPDLGRQPIA